MKLVEVIAGVNTPAETVEAIKKIAVEIGKTPVQVNEAAGFVVNRILIPMINEAAFIKMEGVSDIAGIDAAMKLGANHPMGPLELGDFIGLDICLAIMDVLYNETGDSKYRACPLIRKMVRGGNLGAKSGKGFYVYNADRTKTPVDIGNTFHFDVCSFVDHWIKIRFTTKPAASLTCTGVFPISSEIFLIAETVSSGVFTPAITSISFIRSAGLKKCIPTIGRFNPFPISVMERLDVLSEDTIWFCDLV